MNKLTVHPNHRYLMQSDGTPFFLLADTAWELFHRLNTREANYYLESRAKQGFNAIQAVALSEFEGLTVPNVYGRAPLLQKDGVFDPRCPDVGGDYDYWQHVDYIVNKAAELGLYIMMLPTWGDKFNQKWGQGPEIFNEENARAYGEWIAKRYRDCWNIIWVLGGDRPLETDLHRAVIDAMGQAIRENDPNHLITFHPMGDKSSITCVLGRDYIDFHAVQSGHGTNSYDNAGLLRETGDAEEKPFMDMEPRYEDHPACFKTEYGYYWDGADVRQSAYWAMMEGVMGHTYGNHCIWSMNKEVVSYFPHRWQEALWHEGALCMKYVKELRLSRPYFEFRPAPELIVGETARNARQCAGRGERYAFLYTPLGQPIRAHLEKLTPNPVKASWFNPRNGSVEVIGIVPPEEGVFVPPSVGKGNDWVLILDALNA